MVVGRSRLGRQRASVVGGDDVPGSGCTTRGTWALFIDQHAERPAFPLEIVRETEWPEKCSDGQESNVSGRRVCVDSNKSEEFGRGFVSLKLG